MTQALRLRVGDDRPGVGNVLEGEEGERDPRLDEGARFVDLGDARVAEPGQGLGFPLEATQGVAGSHGALDDLDRRRPPRVFLDGLVHRAHPAGGDDPLDHVGSDFCREFARAVGPVGSCAQVGGIIR